MIRLNTVWSDPWSVIEDLTSWRDDFNRMFDEGPVSMRRAGYPPVNAWVGNDELVVDVALPGADPQKVDIAVEGDELALSGKIEPETLGEAETAYRQERSAGEFRRTLQLPFRAKASGVKAAYKNGVLRITVPRAEEDKPKRIMIEAA
jgi:HSP20 family protein